MTLAPPSPSRSSARPVRMRGAAIRLSPAVIGYGVAGGMSLAVWAMVLRL